MPYALIFKDKPGSLELRTRLRPTHLDYLTENKARILAGGALIDDDGTGGDGGVIIVNTEDRAEAEAFAANDPFTKGGLFESVTIRRWRKAFFNGEKLV
jgi:uncharacterized protein YciI